MKQNPAPWNSYCLVVSMTFWVCSGHMLIFTCELCVRTIVFRVPALLFSLVFDSVPGFGYSCSMFCFLLWAHGLNVHLLAMCSCPVCFCKHVLCSMRHAAHVYNWQHAFILLCFVYHAAHVFFYQPCAFMLSYFVWSRWLWVFLLTVCSRVIRCVSTPAAAPLEVGEQKKKETWSRTLSASHSDARVVFGYFIRDEVK